MTLNCCGDAASLIYVVKAGVIVFAEPVPLELMDTVPLLDELINEAPPVNGSTRSINDAVALTPVVEVTFGPDAPLEMAVTRNLPLWMPVPHIAEPVGQASVPDVFVNFVVTLYVHGLVAVGTT